MNKPATVQQYVDSTSCPVSSGLYLDSGTVTYLQTQLDSMGLLWSTLQPYCHKLIPEAILRDWAQFKEDYADLLALTIAYSSSAQADDYNGSFLPKGDVPCAVQDSYNQFLYHMANFNGILDYQGRRM